MDMIFSTAFKLKRSKLSSALILSVLTLSFTGCQAQPEPNDLPIEQTDSQDAVIVNNTVLDAEAGLSISNAYVKPPLPGRDVSAIYFTLSNTGPKDHLIGVNTTLSDHAEIHTHIKEGDIMRMRRVEDVMLEANGSLIFKPGGYHIMVFGTKLSPVATDAEMTLVFKNAGTKTLTLPIKGRPRPIYTNPNNINEGVVRKD